MDLLDAVANVIGVVLTVVALVIGASSWYERFSGRSEDDFWFYVATASLVAGALLISSVGPMVLLIIAGATMFILLAAWQTAKRRESDVFEDQDADQ